MKNLEGRAEMATKSNPGQPMDTEAIGAATLAWEMGLLAQSCAYLAEEAQIWAQNSADRTLISPESTSNLLLDSIGIMRRLLDTMHRRLRDINEKGDSNAICVLSPLMAEEIRYTLAHDSATSMVECMISTVSQETSNTGGAGDMR